ncbi:STAS domain-containing protein [Candidatus Poriferisodalis multihospitum]|uniref:STAS domain-containing protein n=1 Tax=Candidatus Poriferisodalis multihospitum TaxID=2983191 RepID=UPI002396D966|nr:STAS domain-containing protein [Candidatus Poriferisodalis multihospitum]MDE0135545.1 STAS domain-containing protein [Acidimicrobiaceae bacterium]MDE0318541.1 STAS domain-containing protein [Acidimicrobiaceae bacterium]
MELAQERDAGTNVIRPVGRVDGSNSADLHESLTAALSDEDSRVILDMGGIDYISSAGLRVLLLIAQHLGAASTPFAVCSLAASVDEVFRISGFNQIIQVFGTLDEAKAQLA